MSTISLELVGSHGDTCLNNMMFISRSASTFQVLLTFNLLNRVGFMEI